MCQCFGHFSPVLVGSVLMSPPGTLTDPFCPGDPLRSDRCRAKKVEENLPRRRCWVDPARRAGLGGGSMRSVLAPQAGLRPQVCHQPSPLWRTGWFSSAALRLAVIRCRWRTPCAVGGRSRPRRTIGVGARRRLFRRHDRLRSSRDRRRRDLPCLRARRRSATRTGTARSAALLRRVLSR